MKIEIEKSEYDRLKSREEKYLAYMDMLSYRWEDKTEVDTLCWKVAELEEENKKLNIKVASLEWEIKWLNYTIDRLHKEIEELEKPRPKFSDFWWYDEDEHIVKDVNTYQDLDL